jgi:hypothetical protein
MGAVTSQKYPMESAIFVIFQRENFLPTLCGASQKPTTKTSLKTKPCNAEVIFIIAFRETAFDTSLCQIFGKSILSRYSWRLDGGARDLREVGKYRYVADFADDSLKQKESKHEICLELRNGRGRRTCGQPGPALENSR